MKGGLRQYVAARMIRATRRFLRRTAAIFLLLATAGATVVGVVLYRDGMRSLPPVSVLADVRLPATTQFFANDGTLLAEFYWERRHILYPNEIPAVVRQAFVAAEDGDFYRHRGIDYVALARAFLNNLDASRRVQGASTITQQLVKALLLSEEKTFGRKIREAILARRLEQELSKDEILVLYLNHIYLGSGAYGVQAAAEEYFGKNVGDLTLAEAALLAGLPKAPSRYSPFQNWPRARARQRYVLSRMETEGFITAVQREQALQQPLSLSTPRTRVLAAPHFVDHVRQLLEQRYGPIALRALGLRVRTTLDLRLQHAAETALREGLDAYASRHRLDRAALRDMGPADRDAWLESQRAAIGGGLVVGETYDAVVTFLRSHSARVQIGRFAADLVRGGESDRSFDQLQLNDLVPVRIVDAEGDSPRCVLDLTPPLEGALVALEPQTGYVRALVGGYDYGRSQFNRVTSARRQPGSAFKPFVYASALEHRFTPASVILDDAISFHSRVDGAVWRPSNYERKHFGRTTLAKALTFSRNVVTIKLAQRVGIKRLVRDLERYGFGDLPRGDLSIALGSVETSPLELAAAYGAFANSGRRTEPTFIAEMRDADGQIVGEEPPPPVQVMEPSTAYQITRTLEDVIAWGTGRRARGLAQPAAGKTGTTNGPHDAWFVGYTPQLLASVWVGFDRRRELGKGETGGTLAAPIWKSFMDVAMQGVPVERFTRPEGVKCFYVHNRTGRVANPGDPSQFMCFKKGTGPGPRVRRPEVLERAATDPASPAQPGSSVPPPASNVSAAEAAQPLL
jgi:penicillin-binding protein 1A